MSYVIDIVCINDPVHPPRTLARMSNARVGDLDWGWTCSDPTYDLAERAVPRDGYTFRCRCGKRASVSKPGFHERLDRIRDSKRQVLTLDGVHDALTIDGLHYLRRTQDDPLGLPEPLEPLADARGFFVTGDTP